MKKGKRAVSSDFEDLFSKAVFTPYLRQMRRLILLVSNIAVELLDADGGNVWLLKGSELRLATIINRPAHLLDSFFLDCQCQQGLNWEAITTGCSVLSDDLQHDMRAVRKDIALNQELNSFVCSPISVGKSIIGTISVVGRQIAQFNAEHVATLEWLADLLGLSMQHCLLSLESVQDWINVFSRITKRASAFSIGSASSNKRLDSLWVLSDSLPKGITPSTLARIYQYLACCGESVTSHQVAQGTGISVVTARRYLNYLCKNGDVRRDVCYHDRGRPSFLYCFTYE